MKKSEKEKVSLALSRDLVLCVAAAAEDEGITTEEWVEGVLMLRLLENTGYRSLEDYMKDIINNKK